MEKLTYDIAKEYSIELQQIGELLNDLKEKRIYEISHVPSDGSIHTKVTKLEEKLNALLSKIQNGTEGIERGFAEWFR